MNSNDLNVTADPHLLGPLTRSTFAVGELLALSQDGRTAYVGQPEQPDQPAVAAETTVDLHARHIGQRVVVLLPSAPAQRGVVIGVVSPLGWPTGTAPQGVDVVANGQRLVVSAQREVVLRCGQASLTLREDGCIELRGTSILTHAEGANRIRGGSVQLN
jgi:hypothetical protein